MSCSYINRTDPVSIVLILNRLFLKGVIYIHVVWVLTFVFLLYASIYNSYAGSKSAGLKAKKLYEIYKLVVF